jgi:RNA polymerase-binding transcription factor DksA
MKEVKCETCGKIIGYETDRDDPYCGVYIICVECKEKVEKK